MRGSTSDRIAAHCQWQACGLKRHRQTLHIMYLGTRCVFVSIILRMTICPSFSPRRKLFAQLAVASQDRGVFRLNQKFLLKSVSAIAVNLHMSHGNSFYTPSSRGSQKRVESSNPVVILCLKATFARMCNHSCAWQIPH